MKSAKKIFEREAESRRKFLKSFNELTFVNAIAAVTKETAGEEKKLSERRRNKLVAELHEAGQRTEMCLKAYGVLSVQ